MQRGCVVSCPVMTEFPIHTVTLHLFETKQPKRLMGTAVTLCQLGEIAPLTECHVNVRHLFLSTSEFTGPQTRDYFYCDRKTMSETLSKILQMFK
jgi:hypothetical protein